MITAQPKQNNKRLKLFSSVILICLLLCTSINKNVSAEYAPSKNHQIIAGFLLHFASFVKWPYTNIKSINICLVGEDPFGTYIDEMLKTKPLNRTGIEILIQRIKLGEDLSQCNISFTTKNSTTSAYWNSLPKQRAILLVSEFENFNRIGGQISFYNEHGHVRIEVNLKEVEKSNLQISSELLKLVKLTKEKNGEDE